MWIQGTAKGTKDGEKFYFEDGLLRLSVNIQTRQRTPMCVYFLLFASQYFQILPRRYCQGLLSVEMDPILQ